MTSKTISLTGEEIKVEYSSGANAWLRNDGTDVIYASGSPGIAAGADGVISIPAGQAAAVYGTNGTVYLFGTGSVLLVGSDYAECPFKTSTSSGGSGGVDEVARTGLNAHAGNAEIHVTAAEKSGWDGKAELSDIPAKLPADGGNADTLGNRPPEDFANTCNASLDQYLSGESGDIRALAHLLPPGGFSADTSWFTDVAFPMTGTILLTWTRNSYKADGNIYLYGVLTVRPLASTGDTYICSVYNTELYTDWQKLSDGDNAASVGVYTEAKIAALEARIAALENGG